MKDQILCDISSRRWFPAPGFREKVLQFIRKFPMEEMKRDIEESLKTCPDVYPLGPVHGDMGFANILFNGHQCFLVDFTPSFIQSPLMDLASMELCLFSYKAHPWHVAFFNELKSHFAQFSPQIDIIRKAKALSFYRRSYDESQMSDLWMKFHGFK